MKQDAPAVPTAQVPFPNRLNDRELSQRLARVRVLIADRQQHTAKMIQQTLLSFGIQKVEMTTNGETALELLRSQPFDFLITEWNMHPLDGISLVKAIRAAREDRRIRRDIPIIMLTAQAEMDSVQLARDAGINEYLIKPFSAKTLSNRVIQIIENPRSFVETDGYTGPCRRRRDGPPSGVQERRGTRAAGGEKNRRPAVTALKDIFAEWTVEATRHELDALNAIFAALKDTTHLPPDPKTLIATVKALHDKAVASNYQLGVDIAALLLDYVTTHASPTKNHLVVIGKHIEVMNVVFKLKVEQAGYATAQDLVQSLKKLVTKLQ